MWCVCVRVCAGALHKRNDNFDSDFSTVHFAVSFLDSKFSISENLPSVCKSAWL